MKKLVTFVLFAVALVVAAFATYTKQNARVLRWQSDTSYDAAGSATAVKVDVFVVQQLVNDNNPSDIIAPTQQRVSFDLLDASLSATNITAAGKTVTYLQLAALMRQAALDRANAAGIQ
jgi:hypothetical protein